MKPEGTTSTRIAVVIPTLNEARAIALGLQRVLAEDPDELVVVDGGSIDETVAIARASAVRVIESPRGRAVQQNRGAASTTSDVLLFLHADCHVEPGGLAYLRRFMGEHAKVPGGCFRMRVESPEPVFRAIDRAADMRAGLFGIPYGDQGIFARREVFDRLGGFPEVPLMEDVFLALRLRSQGRIAVLPRQIRVSPRRWRSRGIVRQTLLNWALTAAAAAHVSPSNLARFYPPVR